MEREGGEKELPLIEKVREGKDRRDKDGKHRDRNTYG